ncbi:MAG: FAD-dependent oxidoreductase [Promethearchaeota archaeon]
MSFQLLKSEIIDQQLCQGCGLCSGICNNIEMENLKPALTGSCILEKSGESCGKCYTFCPQANQHLIIPKEPKALYSIKQKEDEPITATLSKYLFNSKKIKRLIKAENVDNHKIQPITSHSEEEANKIEDIAHGRSEILKKLMEEFEDITQNSEETIGIIGTPCEMSGASRISDTNNMNVIKIGSFCDINIPNTQSTHGTIVSPCASSCPAGVDASGYIRLIKQGKNQEAVDLIREQNPLPSICGRICTHECENDCTLISTGNPIAIRELKKYVTDWEIKKGFAKTDSTDPISEGKKVAIVGSGPAGLSAAYYLAKMGHSPTIFEKSDKVGGMLRLGIPQFRLPDQVIDHDIEFIKRAGVKIITNKSAGEDFTFSDMRKEGFGAIFLAIGQYEPYKLGIPGEELHNVHTALDFVQKWKYHIDEGKEFKDKVVGIIGGGSVAIDAAQTALRMGAKKVMVIYRRSENELPARREDYEHSKREGIEYLFLRNPTGFIPDENNNVKAAEIVKMELCDADESGRSKPQEIACSEYEIEKEHVVVAIGQGIASSDIDLASEGKLARKRHKIEIDEITFQTSIPYVFSGGDMVARSKNVAVSAIAHGHQAAKSIDRYLQGEDLKESRYLQERMYSNGKFFTPKAYPEAAPLNEISDLYLSTTEIEAAFSFEYAYEESGRCLGCNNYCLHCQDFAAVDSDIAIGPMGEDGSQDGYNTLIAWTDSGKEILENWIESDNLPTVPISADILNGKINAKLNRKIVNHPKSVREMILSIVLRNGTSTISKLKDELGVSAKVVRYHALRLVQIQKLSMVLGDSEPIFSPYQEE